VEHLVALKKGVEGAIAKGSIKGAYAKVGGGVVLIVDSPSNGQLTVELRKHQIIDAEVVPLVNYLDLLDGHIEFKETGKVEV
jgi:hypothetical protein